VNTAPHPDPHLAPLLMATEHVKTAMKEAITMAENAFNTMKDHSDDQHVSDMLHSALGDGAEYQSKFDAVKSKHVTVQLSGNACLLTLQRQKPSKTSRRLAKNLQQIDLWTRGGNQL
jgi:hypothetical protein